MKYIVILLGILLITECSPDVEKEVQTTEPAAQVEAEVPAEVETATPEAETAAATEAKQAQALAAAIAEKEKCNSKFCSDALKLCQTLGKPASVCDPGFAKCMDRACE